ncbi:hypothetical protein ABVT39_017927, partial [Epinephelus coioides]
AFLLEGSNSRPSPTERLITEQRESRGEGETVRSRHSGRFVDKRREKHKTRRKGHYWK